MLQMLQLCRMIWSVHLGSFWLTLFEAAEEELEEFKAYGMHVGGG